MYRYKNQPVQILRINDTHAEIRPWSGGRARWVPLAELKKEG